MNVVAVPGLPEIEPGEDLAGLVEAHAAPDDETVVCLASTVVSKAEGRVADLADYDASARAEAIAADLAAVQDADPDPRFVQAILDESRDVLIESPFLLTRTQFGHVTVNAGVDRSNVPGGDLLLLPEDPTASAERVRAGLHADPAVVLTDTCGRPFRHGQRGVAVGWAGMPAARDWRGEHDREGRELSATVQAVVDELAAAANCVAGEGADGTPLVTVEGFEFGAHAGSEDLFRSAEDDLVQQALAAWEGPA